MMKRKNLKYWSLICLLMVCACSREKAVFTRPEKGFTSWLPAKNWEDALLSGNGTLGAMVMGDPYQERIILNHALLYIPNDAPVVPPDMTSHLKAIRELSFEGRYQEVAELGVQVWKERGYGDKKWTDPYVPAADITIDMPAANVHDYQRSVNFETAEAMVNWSDDNGLFTRQTFVSRADGIVVTRIQGTNSINAQISIPKHPHSWEQNSHVQSLIKASNTFKVENGMLAYRCEYNKPHQSSPLGYHALMKVIVKQGEMETDDNTVHVHGASEVMIISAIDPLYELNNNAVAVLSERLNGVRPGYNALLKRQIKSHGELYNRMSLNLFPEEGERTMDSEVLVKNVKAAATPGMMQRQFEAARYNILCSTGANPPNLQGIWSGTWTPPWSSDFTHDGNVEVAISHLLNGNMPELMLAYFDLHERFLDDYKANARQLYGTRGIQVPSRTSTHGYNNHYDETWCMEYWNAGAGWAASYFYDYFLYTRDTTFLKERAFPFITEALLFWEDFLIEGQDGRLVSVPSYSPENNPMEHRWQNCINATMDIVVAKELARNWIASARILGMDEQQIREKEKFISALPDYQISPDGVLKEWLWPGFTDNQSHRHASHLYGLYEVPDPDLLQSEALMAAAEKTIHERMKIRKQHEGGEMAFGMCHLANAAVNINDRETASEILTYLSRFYWTNGLATLHNPGNLFNMDISGGFPSLITRMIINSRPGHLDVLSTIPDGWKKGEVTGILARGGVEVKAVTWDERRIVLSLVSAMDQDMDLQVGEQWKATLNSVEGAGYEIDKEIVKVHMPKDKTVTVYWEL